MKKFRKLMAVLAAMTMAFTMVLPVMAAGEKPVDTDKAAAKVSNVEFGATVKAYQIVKADYNDYGFTGYSKAAGVTLANLAAPTSDEVSAIAKAINDGSLSLASVTMTAGGTTGLVDFTGNLAPGYWVVLVNGAVEEVYNPMLIGVYYSKSGSDNTMTAGPVDANSKWTLETINAYAKSTDPSIDKTIVNPGSGNPSGDDVAVGDEVKFQIDTAIPSYSKQYTQAIVKISDELSAGLKLVENSVTVDGLTKDTDYTITTTSGGFVITIKSDYALTHGGAALKINYRATLTSAAGINFDANTNKATLEYSNNPANVEDTKEKDDITYHYTFGIDASLSGKEVEGNKVTHEIIKADENGDRLLEKTESYFEGDAIEHALGNATFTLTNNAGGKVYTAVSDATGRLKFTGLDAGTYSFVETVAPEGYTVDHTPHTVVIDAVYNDNGTLQSYSIKIDGKATSTYTAVYEGNTVTTISSSTETTIIKNTKLSQLPSTGGVGTYLFTIIGVTIMAAAAILLFVHKKRKV